MLFPSSYVKVTGTYFKYLAFDINNMFFLISSYVNARLVCTIYNLCCDAFFCFVFFFLCWAIVVSTLLMSRDILIIEQQIFQYSYIDKLTCSVSSYVDCFVVVLKHGCYLVCASFSLSQFLEQYKCTCLWLPMNYYI